MFPPPIDFSTFSKYTFVNSDINILNTQAAAKYGKSLHCYNEYKFIIFLNS